MNDSEFLTKAEAAFWLGFFARWPLVDVMRNCLATLNEEIGPNVCTGMYAAIQRLEESDRRLDREKQLPAERRFKLDAIDKSTLEGLAQKAILPANPYYGWQQLGTKLGNLAFVREDTTSPTTDEVRLAIEAVGTFYTSHIEPLNAFMAAADTQSDATTLIERLVEGLSFHRSSDWPHQDIGAVGRFAAAIVYGLQRCPSAPSSVDEAEDARDRWLYQQLKKHRSDKDINAEFEPLCKTSGWEYIKDPASWKRAIHRLRKRDPKLPELTPRRRGRKRGGKKPAKRK